jgi:hypothetical protein
VAKLVAGQSMNFAKLKRNAAFSWYSPGASVCARATGAQAEHKSAINRKAAECLQTGDVLRDARFSARVSKLHPPLPSGVNA